VPTIAALREELDDGRVTAVELVTRTLDAIEAAEAGPEGLNAVLSLRRELAVAEAEALDWEREEGIELGLLAGIPVLVKDNMAVAEGPTTAGSRILEGFVPPYDAGAVARLKYAGAIIVGKTNLDEFAMGSSNENSAFGPVRNPRDRSRVPGGSSGGSAAAVAAGYVPAALGSDTGGSIRQPAALCGVVGLKPTYGRVSRYGLVAFASSLDQIGPLTSTVEDAARVLSAIAGHDPLDSTSAARPVPDYAHGLERPLRGLRVGVPREYLPEGLHPGVRSACDRAVERLRSAGATVKEVALPHTDAAIAAYYVVATAEASSNLARYDGVRYGLRAPDPADVHSLYVRTRHAGFGPEVRRRILLGTYVLSAGYYDAYYRKGCEARALVAEDFERVFSEVHCLLTPTSPTPAFRLGEKADDPLAMYLADVFTVPVNLAGIPAISVPGQETEGLPVGVQVIGPRWSEDRLLNVAWHLENEAAPGARVRPGDRGEAEPRESEPEPVAVGADTAAGDARPGRRGGRRGDGGGAGRGRGSGAGGEGSRARGGGGAPRAPGGAADGRGRRTGRGRGSGGRAASRGRADGGARGNGDGRAESGRRARDGGRDDGGGGVGRGESGPGEGGGGEGRRRGRGGRGGRR
jgi:aspartyl-tRNA(Asn)/glutamyl-tRNA(Gln) amidotransferase subunit A